MEPVTTFMLIAGLCFGQAIGVHQERHDAVKYINQLKASRTVTLTVKYVPVIVPVVHRRYRMRDVR